MPVAARPRRKAEARADAEAGPSARAGTVYYVSDCPGASDRNDGITRSTAWRTVDRASAHAYKPGDALLFRGGGTFRGTLELGRSSAGTPEKPIRVGSFGRGRATILAGAGSGLVVTNASGIEVRDLVFRGDGVGQGDGGVRGDGIARGDGGRRNRGCGIAFLNTLGRDTRLAHVRINRVEVSGFGRFGIVLLGRRGKSGYRDVRITRANVHHNREGGITTLGRFSRTAAGYAHADVYIARCDVHHTTGYARSRRHVGSGIVVSDVDGAVVEHCRAWENGALCTCKDGPVGIWAWDANAVVIQFCESHHNRTSGPADGGGFDLDGGVTNSVLQHNYSHDNDGAGFGVYQFRDARPMGGNVVRQNLSVDDGRKNGCGGIQLMNWGSGVRDLLVCDNVVFVGPGKDLRTGGPGRQKPSALRLKSATAGVRVERNVLVTSGGVPAVRVRGRQQSLRFRGNVYRALAGPLRMERSGRVVIGVAEWAV